ncbi:MAG: hypothetical protein JL55_34630 [Pseudomonas sp. BICA1-14]|nr:MAG: hypothetical protein VR76_15005 [Pseudomonas sp. BRH_c35]KJS68944.1 MAG: hypothetical protein JL55_34630 [[Pseudomonas] sp. BICA1-14]
MTMLIAMSEWQLTKICWDPFFLPKAGRTDSGNSKLKVSVNSRGVMCCNFGENLISNDIATQLCRTQA